jgi:hypothetical protein
MILSQLARRTADLTSQPDLSSPDCTYTLIGMGNEQVRPQRLADGTVNWYDPATTFDDTTPVHVPIADTTPASTSPQRHAKPWRHGPLPPTQHSPQLIHRGLSTFRCN